jgi:hypothetical protein
MLEWIEEQWKPAIDSELKSTKNGLKRILIYLASKNSLLVFDSARFHKTEAIKEAAKRLKTVIAVIPGGLTSVLQPLDVSFNRPLRLLVQELQDELLNHDDDPEDFSDWSIPKGVPS